MVILRTAMVLISLMCGFNTPESMLPYKRFIFVSNVNGSPLKKDGNGYISKLSFRGKMIKKKFITGLNAPKGMAVYNNALFVTDIDRVYAFNADTGEKLTVFYVKGAKFLNDIAVNKNGTLFVTDMYTHKIHKIKNGIVSTYITRIKYPNGIVTRYPGELFVVQFKGGKLYKIDRQGRINVVARGIHSGDGLGFGPKNRYIYASSWKKGVIYKINVSTGEKRVIYSGLKTPADIFVDNTFKRILIPLMKKNCIVAKKIR